MSALFITAAGTGVGKTLVTAALTFQLKQKGHNAMALKPVISGFEDGGKPKDTTILAAAAGLGPGPATIERISPWRFKAPLSPNIAAAKEGREIPIEELVAFCKKMIAENENTLIEGIGGSHVPLAKGYLVADWIKALNIPALVVSGSYLGALSHTLTTLKALEGAGINVAGVVVSESLEEPMALAETVTALWDQTPKTKIVSLKRIAKTPPWKHATDLTEFVNDL